MGDHHEGWAQPNDLVPNGLLANDAGSVTQVLDQERWTIAEERTAELIACIQPNQPSEELRNAVADYVQRLIMKCFSCQVFTFGSVPLKTYLPDGDIDLTAFSKNQTVKDSWATEVRNMLESEEKSDDAEFRVKEVQYIQAEVKIIKCLVENIVVDISFNQLGGLCTLCFLEEVDNLINQDHLFKRSIILIKAWCYYESRILGAHHGLISTYALETLVLYIFHVFNNSFAGPLEVLYRFLEFFSNFDWENFCVSLWGPVPIRSLPDMTAESPRKDGGELLLNKTFLDNCSSVYAVFPGGQENQGQPFVSKHFNVIDPLRTTNNLGRSVSKGNFFRIRSAFAFGAKRLARLLDCPREDIIAEVNQFFMNTWERHGCGRRPDAPRIDLYHLRRLNSDSLGGSSNLKNSSSNRKKSENSGSHDSETEGNHAFHDVSYPHGNHPSESISKTSYTSAVSRTQNQKGNGNLTSTRVSDQVARNISPSGSVIEKGQRSSRPDYLVNEMQGRFQFARTRSSPELLDTSSEISSRGRRNRVPETVKSQMAASKQEYSSRRKNLGSEVSGVHGARSSTDDPSLLRQSSSHQSLDTADSNCTSNNYHDEGGLSALGEELASVSETMEMHQEEQDLVNMMASSGLHGYPGHIQMPMNVASSRLPFPISPSVLASMGYSQRNFPGMIPANLPLMEPPWGPNMQFPHGLVSSQLSHYFPNTELASNPEETVDSGNENSGLAEMNQEESEHGFWHEQDAGSARGFDDDNGNAQTVIFDDRQQRTSVGYNLGSSGRVSSSSSGNSYVRDHHKFSKENRGIVREDQDDTYRHLNNRRNDTNNSEKNADPRPLPASHTSSSRSKASSESSWDGSSKASKSTREKRGRKTAPLVPPVVYGKGKSGWQYEGLAEHGSQSTDDSIRDWIPLSTMGAVMAERSAGPTSVSSQLQSHQISNRDSGQMNGSDSTIPMAPMLLGSGSRQRVMDNSGVVPFAFYPTGPPVPFLTMLPVYNFPAEAGNSEGSTNHFDRDEGFDNARVNQSDQNFDSAESLDQSEVFSPNSVKSVPLDSIEHRSDILNSDFASHWHNLQYGRLCQNPRYHGPLIYPSPVMVPPMYLQGHFPWDGPGRPLSANMNVFNQFLGYGPRFIPVAPLQPGSGRPGGVYQRYGDEVPRYRGGTGTYLPNPNPKVEGFRDRQPSGSKNHRGNYNYDRSDHHSDRDGNWNSSKSRSVGRNHARNQAEKTSSRLDRLTGNHNRANVAWDSYRHESVPSFHSQNGPFGSSNSMHGGSSNNAYGMYPLPPVNSNGVAPTGPAVPSVVMLYSYDHNVGYNSPAEQLEFGSLGPVPVSSVNEVSHHDEGEQSRGVFERQRFQGGSALSSPDQPSSPQFQRLVSPRNYQLKDEDFPPLSFPNQGGNGDGNNYNEKVPHYPTFLFTSNA